MNDSVLRANGNSGPKHPGKITNRHGMSLANTHRHCILAVIFAPESS